MNMKRSLIQFVSIIILIAVTTAIVQAEANFSASSLNASDVNCKKCHIDTPHVIHAQKPAASCENCHGDKTSVAIPQCTKCHNGPIHKVHAGKIDKGCDYCHKNIAPIHTNLTSEAVCSHCHTDLVKVHGESQSCVKCHKTPPEIVKPLKAEGMVLVCQNCHPAASVASIHGDINDKQGCYSCHKGSSKLNGSEIPHNIHQTKASCKDCHEENGRVVIPQCTRCHKIDELHAFNKIGKLTTKSGLTCSVCHADISKPAKVETAKTDTNATENIKTNVTKKIETSADVTKVKGTETVIGSDEKEEDKGPMKIPGFEIIPGVVILYMVARKINK